ncbi:hypothetical protein HFP15_22215 [Amycolatopsis sp. K13G38]|uniref:Cupin domain-containing protein n=1 Tax=Amycolatopsis acididurans TaxID=2724524 RepID=A0ABX1J735_9PSEU|nr:hypothetical protein [Amycolatopsis acididurans]NKQ55602.1 hypothetical protein [Amycolatopsis acididurans]
MKTTTIAPDLTLDEAMFEAAAEGFATDVPDLAPLTWERFTHAPDWTLVPNDCGDAYKAELVLRNTRDSTLKLNIWNLPDLRGGEVSQPHSHPWHFTAHVLLGGYNEDRYSPENGTIHRERGVEHTAGCVNDVPKAVYHEVTAIHDPGRTVSLMVCGQGARGDWGYLDLATGEREPVRPDPDFAAKLRALNPHQR